MSLCSNAFRGFLVSLAVVSGASAQRMGQAPPYVPIQGYLIGRDGTPVTGSTDLTLSLYMERIGGDAFFTERQTVAVADGVFTTYIGNNSVLDLIQFNEIPNGIAYLGVAVDGDAEMTPRLQLGTAPYAAFAQQCGDAATLGGKSLAELDISTGDPSSPSTDSAFRYTAPAGSGVLISDDIIGLDASGCEAGSILKYDGAAWACAPDEAPKAQATTEKDNTIVARDAQRVALSEQTIACPSKGHVIALINTSIRWSSTLAQSSQPVECRINIERSDDRPDGNGLQTQGAVFPASARAFFEGGQAPMSTHKVFSCGPDSSLELVYWGLSGFDQSCEFANILASAFFVPTN